jgi:hypothetical protein
MRHASPKRIPTLSPPLDFSTETPLCGWRGVWRGGMRPFEAERDRLHDEPGRRAHLDAARLMKRRGQRRRCGGGPGRWAREPVGNRAPAFQHCLRRVRGDWRAVVHAHPFWEAEWDGPSASATPRLVEAVKDHGLRL